VITAFLVIFGIPIAIAVALKLAWHLPDRTVALAFLPVVCAGGVLLAAGFALDNPNGSRLLGKIAYALIIVGWLLVAPIFFLLIYTTVKLIPEMVL
jgi:hypothetical protein